VLWKIARYPNPKHPRLQREKRNRVGKETKSKKSYQQDINVIVNVQEEENVQEDKKKATPSTTIYLTTYPLFFNHSIHERTCRPSITRLPELKLSTMIAAAVCGFSCGRSR
jgi:hypothetical protein